MKFKRMGHAALHVADIVRSVAFYRDILGLKANYVGDADWANLALGPDDLSLVRTKDHKHPPHLGFRVESLADLQAAHAELKKAGVAVENITVHRDQSSTFYFKDPDENILEAVWDPHAE